MNSDDLIKRGDVLKEAVYLNVDTSEMVVFVQDINGIPAVPHEMSAREYIREYRRMCNFYFGKPAIDGGWDGCGDCPGRLNGKKDCIFSPTRNESSIPVVEKWAREHPEERNEK